MSAQRAGFDRPSNRMVRIDAEEGAARLAAFRNQRLVGDFYFEFQLEHKPRRARTTRYEGQMWGTWNAEGPVTRFLIQPESSRQSGPQKQVEHVELIVQNGERPLAWIRRSADGAFQQITGEALFEPILPGLLYSPFDLQMPFVYWDEFIYEGPALAGISRVAQQFLMLPPEGSASAQRGISGVRIGLDDTYDALLRIEVVDSEDSVMSRFAVESFQKVDEQYIVKRITLTDQSSRDRTTFRVEAASVGLSLGRDLFDPVASVAAQDYKPETLEKL
ncbi:MAG: hypothetical protein EA353_02180 [Puniceicoccaceae bacterium]|nr:MAG: hypothetical protein EA353_02180 [Puniceicoccaceae bacterium]